uniref:Reverse transcriptase domain-containing protein n=1 Tax=Cannabis sativa TaxID=3483 RepID=A0A803Q5S5_CANSA
MMIDLRKAYDIVDLDFVADLLKGLCFPSRFINWILVCLRGISYSLMLNGGVHGSFMGEKGLRQGDPISPLLFVLVMEYLNRLLLQASTVKANLSKSSIYFGGVDMRCKKQMLNSSKLIEGSFPLKYLEVNLRPTKSKDSDCGGIVEKIHKKLHGWMSRHLFFAGRALLVQSVFLGIRNYWVNIFILPQKVTSEIDKLCRDFLWGKTGNRSKLHFISWSQVCLPKDYGGIGFMEGKKVEYCSHG